MCLKMPTQSSMPEQPDTRVNQTENKSDHVSSTEDTEPASDEVKVYEEEEAEDERLEPASKALSALSDDKSRLITEAEQSKETVRGLHEYLATSKHSK